MRTKKLWQLVAVAAFASCGASALAQRGDVPYDVEQQIRNVERDLQDLERTTDYLYPQQKRAVAQRLDNTVRQLQAFQSRLNRGGGNIPGPGPRRGQWISTNGGICSNVCAAAGGALALSPESATCASGETRPLSALQSGIPFIYGTWPDSSPHPSPVNSQSSGQFCYRPGQQRDNDRSDITIGCFCSSRGGVIQPFPYQ